MKFSIYFESICQRKYNNFVRNSYICDCFKIVHGFHMVVTRSSAKTTNMSVLREIREYFSELVKPLATIEILEDKFKKLKDEIISKSEEKFDEQDRKIDELKGKIAIQANTIDQLIINMMIKNNIVEQLPKDSQN